MPFLRNLKIGARLAVGFGALLTLTIALGLDGLGASHGTTADLATNWLVATRYLTEYEADVNAERRAEIAVVIGTTAESRAAESLKYQAAQLAQTVSVFRVS